MSVVTIVNYGLGNIQAFANIYKRLNIDFNVAATAGELRMANKVILPGVGAFDWAMTRLNDSGMRKTLDELVLGKQKPILGICVGMQMMAQRSEEGALDGLRWIDGCVRKFDVSALKSKTCLPHMGWNTVNTNNGNPLMSHCDGESRFYFLHSYYFQCNNPQDVIATTEYAIQYASAVNHENIYGVQFHPEKSHRWGIQLLKNFAEM